jgi:hypothetical protein
MDASDRERSLLALHGAIVLLLGLLSGLPAVYEELAGLQPTTWRAAHAALLLAGVWLLATAALLPSLVLPPRHRKTLAWALIATAYAFTGAVLIQAITGVRALSPRGTASSWIAFLANLATVPAGLLAALLTLLGAKDALVRARGPGPPGGVEASHEAAGAAPAVPAQTG